MYIAASSDGFYFDSLNALSELRGQKLNVRFEHNGVVEARNVVDFDGLAGHLSPAERRVVEVKPLLFVHADRVRLDVARAKQGDPTFAVIRLINENGSLSGAQPFQVAGNPLLVHVFA